MGSRQVALRRHRVLVAVARNAWSRIAAVVRGWDVRYVESAPELVQVLGEEEHDLIIVGAQFDESNAIGALEEALSRARSTPVVCVRGTPFARSLGAGTLDALRLASEALGAEHFIDLDRFPDDAEGHARVRAMLERLIER